MSRLICCGYSLESPYQGNSNEYPQRMFLLRNKHNYPSVIIKYPPYLSSESGVILSQFNNTVFQVYHIFSNKHLGAWGRRGDCFQTPYRDVNKAGVRLGPGSREK